MPVIYLWTHKYFIFSEFTGMVCRSECILLLLVIPALSFYRRPGLHNNIANPANEWASIVMVGQYRGLATTDKNKSVHYPFFF